MIIWRLLRDMTNRKGGTEILLLPDVKTMGKAMEAHVNHYIQKLKTPANIAAAEAESLRDALIAQVFSK